AMSRLTPEKSRDVDAAANRVGSYDRRALIDDVWEVALIDCECQMMGLRQMVRCNFDACAYVPSAIGGVEYDSQRRLERIKRRLIALPVVQILALASEPLDIGYHQNRALNENAGSRRSAVAGHNEPVPVVGALGFGQLPRVHPQFKSCHLQ